jgi:predicted anti-sigma-YlaC factor YlaD
MSAHLSNELVERFHAQALTRGDRSVIYDHVLACETCRQLVVTPQEEAVALEALMKHLVTPESEKPYHLDLEAIEAFVDDKLDPLDRSTAKLHLEDCAECSSEVEDLRESLATMKAASHTRVVEHQASETVSRRFSMPLRIAAVIALIAVATVALIGVLKWRSTSPGITTGSQPTPFTSPQLPALAPSPGSNPPNLAENPPSKKPGEEPRRVIALKDGPNGIAIDEGGNVVGASSLSSETRQAVKEALTEERLTRPSVLDEVASAQVSERGPSGPEERIRIVYPVRTVIADTQPTLRWAPSKTAEAYRIEIADETFHQVAKSEDLPTTTGTWAPTTPLKRGGIYTWTIRAVNKEGDASAVVSQGKFKVLSQDRVGELNQLKTSQSHFALGLFYAREGMVADAEREFRILLKANPNSPVLKKLIKDVGSWQKR